MGYEKNEMIMALLKAKGPILPVEAAKKVDTDIIIASAYLATMVSRSEVKISHLKIGGSPLYYLPGQEAMLQNFTDRLNPPEKRVYELIKEKMVLRDRELEPVQRVSIRALKDFALPLNVKHEGNTEIFWKWYMLKDDEAEVFIKKHLMVETEVAPVKIPSPAPAESIKPLEQAKPEQEITLPIHKEVAEKPQEKEEEPAKEPTPKKERKKRQAPRQEKLTTEPEDKKAAEIAMQVPIAEQRFSEPETKDKFFEDVKEYFGKNSIMVLESAIVKKNSELDMVISVPSAVGRLTYYCKAKNKKKSNDGDLASAYVQGQSRKLPTLYLSRGELAKKASEMLAKEFRGIVVKTF